MNKVSLHFTLITLGVGLLFHIWIDALKDQNIITEVLEVYGSVPMFAYIIHLYVIFIVYWVMYWLFGANHSERFGVNSVWQIWIATFLLVVVLYYPTKKFAKYKHENKKNKPWLSYL